MILFEGRAVEREERIVIKIKIKSSALRRINIEAI
jgi:hypothetical protein